MQGGQLEKLLEKIIGDKLIVLVFEVDLIIYESNSLKEKRSVINSLIRRLQTRFNASIAEVGNLELWSKSKLGVALISNDKKHLQAKFSKIINFIDQDHRVETISIYKEFI